MVSVVSPQNPVAAKNAESGPFAQYLRRPGPVAPVHHPPKQFDPTSPPPATASFHSADTTAKLPATPGEDDLAAQGTSGRRHQPSGEIGTASFLAEIRHEVLTARGHAFPTGAGASAWREGFKMIGRVRPLHPHLHSSSIARMIRKFSGVATGPRRVARPGGPARRRWRRNSGGCGEAGTTSSLADWVRLR
jgi:hypothetical protein